MKTNRFKYALFFILFICSASSFAQNIYTLGQDYALIDPAVTPQSTEGVEVVELFWYGCPHCFEFEPYLSKWLKSKPKHVNFSRMPAQFRKSWKAHAKAYYSLLHLDNSEQLHKAIFDEVHLQKMPLNNKFVLREFFISQGVDGQEFDDLFNSFGVGSQVNRAKSMARKYAITGVPSMIVAGKYRVDGRMAGNYSNLIKIVNFLIEKSLAEQTKQ